VAGKLTPEQQRILDEDEKRLTKPMDVPPRGGISTEKFLQQATQANR